VFSRDGLIYKFFSHNKYVLAVVIIAPLLLYFVFGTSFYGYLDDIGEEELRGYDLDKDYDGDMTFFDDEPIDEDEYEKVNPYGGEENISKMHQYSYEESFFPSLISLASVSFIVGAVISSLSWGRMASDGSIVYPILLKSSRTKSFMELFLLPLVFILLISVFASLLVTSEVFVPFLEIGFRSVFFYSLLTVLGTMFGGYTIALLISLISRDSFLPIFGSLLFVGGVNLWRERFHILSPSRGLVTHHYFDHPIENEVYYGILIIIAAFILSYFFFKRGDFY